MNPSIVRRTARLLALLVAGCALALTGCDDPIEPFVWGNFPDTTELYSLARTDYVNRPAAYDFLTWPGSPVTVEALSLNPFAFDIAVTEDDAGDFVLLPTGYFPDARVRPGIFVNDTASFESLSRAPSEGYVTDEPVDASTDVVYVIRSRSSGRGCTRYGKLEILSMADGVMTIRTLVNRNCGDRGLVPNLEEDEEEEPEEP